MATQALNQSSLLPGGQAASVASVAAAAHSAMHQQQQLVRGSNQGLLLPTCFFLFAFYGPTRVQQSG
jgi:hypothetical protein